MSLELSSSGLSRALSAPYNSSFWYDPMAHSRGLCLLCPRHAVVPGSPTSGACASICRIIDIFFYRAFTTHVLSILYIYVIVVG